MKRTTIDGIEYIISRQRPGRPVELVRIDTGELVLHHAPVTTPVIIHELPTIPKLVPFSQRGGLAFVESLQARRLEALKENVKARKVHKGPGGKAKGAGTGVRKARGASAIAAQMIKQEVEESLGKLDSSAAEKLRRFMNKKGL